MHSITNRRTVASVLVVAAIAAPSATAAPVEQFLPNGINAGLGPTQGNDERTSGTSGSDVAVVRTVEVPSSGFDWGDAGIGAAGLLSLLGLGAGAVVVGRRSRARSHPAIS